MSQQKPAPTGGGTDPAGTEISSDAPVETAAAPAVAPAASSAPGPAVAEPEVSEPEELADVTAEGYLVLDEDVETYVEGPSLAAKLGVEALGTFFLVFAGVGVALYSTFSGVGGTLAVALAFGIAVLAGIIAFGRISGGHFNPAVTLGAAVAGRTRWADVLPYWLAQVVGGALGAADPNHAIGGAVPAALAWRALHPVGGGEDTHLLPPEVFAVRHALHAGGGVRLHDSRGLHWTAAGGSATAAR